MDNWGVILQAYRTYLHIPGIVVDLMAVSPIIELLAKGYSNTTIGEMLDENPEKVSRVVQEVMGFNGWESDLDFNPQSFYQRSKFNMYKYVQEVQTLSPATAKCDIVLSYKVNQRLDRIKKEISKYE